MKLIKYIGLYHLLNPHITQIRGYNVYHIINVCFGLLIVAVSTLGPFGLYYLTNDVVAFMLSFGMFINHLFCVCKVFTIIYYAKDLWICSEIGSFNCLSYQYYNKSILKTRRRQSTIISYGIIIIVILAFITWIPSPYIFNETMITIKKIDGSLKKYRINLFNLYFIFAAETYNKYYIVFYIIENTIGSIFLYFTTVFDIFLVLMCFALFSQLETISDGIESLGRNHSEDNFSKYSFCLSILNN